MQYNLGSQHSSHIQRPKLVQLEDQLRNKNHAKMISKLIKTFYERISRKIWKIKDIFISYLHKLHATSAFPVYPGKHIHFAEWNPVSHLALVPQFFTRHASTQLPS